MRRPSFPIFVILCWAVAGAWLGPSTAYAQALTSDGLLLVVNRNAPHGLELAHHYAAARAVPDGRIVELDLPTTDDISPDEYESRLADPLRARLAADPALAERVRCIVTFHGVPFRIPPRGPSPAVSHEVRQIESARREVEPKLIAYATEAERLARLADPAYAPLDGRAGATVIESAVARVRHAVLATAAALPAAEEARRGEVETAWRRLSEAMERPLAPLDEPLPEPSTSPATTAAVPVKSPGSLAPGAFGWGDAHHRRALRAQARARGPVFLAQVLDFQSDFLTGQQTDAAVDSELACLAWGPYRRSMWGSNPLRYDVPRDVNRPITYMAMRLDGPTPEGVRKLIDDSIAAERNGGPGSVVVLDSWNKPLRKPDGSLDGYGRYDETLRRLRDLLTARGLRPAFDASDQLIPEMQHRNIGVYCGWYDPNRVVLPGTFARGAVGFHIASFAAVGVRGQGGGWWVPALLSAGVVSTIGPVSEPYLTAFPDADEYWPLVLTGRLTMAEAWWKTSRKTSWKMLAVGDPLYTPYRNKPLLSAEALSPELARALDPVR